jgi:hypothetical protein
MWAMSVSLNNGCSAGDSSRWPTCSASGNGALAGGIAGDQRITRLGLLPSSQDDLRRSAGYGRQRTGPRPEDRA